MKDKDLLLYNGHFITLDPNNPQVNWIYMQNGYIVDQGSDEGYKEYGHRVPKLDVKGNYGVPGFIDSHVHLVQSGLNKLGNHVDACRSIQEVLKTVQHAEIESTKWGDMIRCVAWEEIKMKEKRMPTRWEIDAVVSNKLVWISSIEYHVTIVNSLTFKCLNLPFNLEGIERDEKGRPTGVLTGRANFLARKKLLGIISDKTRKKGVNIVIENAIKQGVTTINAMEGGFLFHDRDAVFVHQNCHDIPIDIELFFQTPTISKVEEMGLTRAGGCFFLDGSFQARTAALEYPYEDMPSTRGKLFFRDEDIDRFAEEAISKNLDITVHAIASRSIGQILNAYEKSKKDYPKSTSRIRIEHFELPNAEQIELAARLGVFLSMQPAYEYFWGGRGRTYEKRLGMIRRKKTNPYATLIKKGCIIAGGSDSDVTPIDPLLGIHAAVNHPTPKESISRLEALKMFTINGARVLGKEQLKGKLGVGYMGDICILGENLFHCNENSIKDIPVLGTIKSGQILYLSKDISDRSDVIA
ncbi:amidohydrolase [Clostridiaceae bacterium 35-E11]